MERRREPARGSAGGDCTMVRNTGRFEARAGSMSTAERYSSERRRRQYRIGEFTLDLDEGFLRRAAEEIALRPKTFEVLTYLVQRAGRLVTKNELIEAVWPDTAITDNSL